MPLTHTATDENAPPPSSVKPKMSREQMLEIFKNKREAEKAEKLKSSRGSTGSNNSTTTVPVRRPLQATNGNSNTNYTAPNSVTRLSLRKTTSENYLSTPAPYKANPRRAEVQNSTSRPGTKKVVTESATKVLGQYDLRSRTAPVNKTRSFSVFGENKAPKQTPTPAQRSKNSPPRTLNTLDDLFSNPSTPSLYPDSPPKQDGAMLLEEIGSPLAKTGKLSLGIFGTRTGLRPRPLASSTNSPTRRGDHLDLVRDAEEKEEFERLKELAESRAGEIEVVEAEKRELRELVEKLRDELADANAKAERAEKARQDAEIALASRPSNSSSPAPEPQFTSEVESALRKELADAYEVITLLEPRENWIDPADVKAEETRLHKVIEELDDRVMESEVAAFKAQKELALETQRLEEANELLEAAMKENEDLHAALESRPAMSSSSGEDGPRPMMCDGGSQTEEPWDKLFQEANKAIVLARLVKFGNAAMYQQMLENNEEFKAAYEDLAEQLRQEKETTAALMQMQEQLLANLQQSYEDEEADAAGEEQDLEVEEDETGADDETGEIKALPGTPRVASPVVQPELGGDSSDSDDDSVFEDAKTRQSFPPPGLCDTPRPGQSPERSPGPVRQLFGELP